MEEDQDANFGPPWAFGNGNQRILLRRRKKLLLDGDTDLGYPPDWMRFLIFSTRSCVEA
jgi:hypothetical protein